MDATTRTAAEQDVLAVVAPVLAAAEPDIAAALAERDSLALEAALAALMRALRGAVVVVFYDLILAEVVAQTTATGVVIDEAEAIAAAADAATGQSQRLISQVEDTTRTALSRVLAQADTLGEEWQAAIAAMIAPLFSRTRAETIAISETTAAASTGALVAQRIIQAAGSDLVLVNRTAADDRVCRICRPLDGVASDQWPDPAGPPWHPRCRCDVELIEVAS